MGHAENLALGPSIQIAARFTRWATVGVAGFEFYPAEQRHKQKRFASAKGVTKVTASPRGTRRPPACGVLKMMPPLLPARAGAAPGRFAAHAVALCSIEGVLLHGVAILVSTWASGASWRRG